MANNIFQDKVLIKTLKDGGIAVIPTDTIYGIVGRAEYKNTVERIYETRRRSPDRPCIILIGDKSEVSKFSVKIYPEQEKVISENWSSDSAQDKPRAVSIVLDCVDEKFEYLHRGTKTLAFRIPNDENLKEFLRETGPLIAPSANPEGYPGAKGVDEATGYFGNAVDCYLDGGILEGKASKVVRLFNDGSMSIIRE